MYELVLIMTKISRMRKFLKIMSNKSVLKKISFTKPFGTDEVHEESLIRLFEDIISSVGC